MSEEAHPGEVRPGEPPLLLVVDGEAGDRAQLAGALSRRFGADYAVAAAASGREALALVEGARGPVALVAADVSLPDLPGVELLQAVHARAPGAARALLLPMAHAAGAGGPGDPVRAAMLGRIDLSILKGWVSPEEWLYPQVQEALSAWALEHRPRHEHVRIVGARWAPRSHALRDLLTRNGVPFGFYAAGTPPAAGLLAEHGLDGARLPAVLLFDGRALLDPTDRELAAALGVHTRPALERYDLAVVGAGPAGLAAAVYGASEGLRTVVVEPVALGGQAGASSRIRNYLGFPRGLSGAELAARAFEQARAFGAEFVFTRSATGLGRRGDDLVVSLSDDARAVARAVVIATGASYRRLSVPALDGLVGRGVFYGAASAESRALSGEHVLVVGGGNSAGQAALHLARFAARVTLVVRGESLGAGMSDYLVRDLAASPRVEVRLRTRVVDGGGDDRLERVTVEDATLARETLDAVAMFVLIGATPRTDWLGDALQRDGAGYVLTGADVSLPRRGRRRPPLPLEGSLPGVFAAGDVRHGSVKRVAAAAGEGSVAIGSVQAFLAGPGAGGGPPD